MPPEDVVRGWQRWAPFISNLKIELVEMQEGRAVLALPFSHTVENRKGNIHGGAIASLADVAMGQAIRAAQEGLFSLSTVNMNVSYLAPGAGDLTAHARCTRMGGTMAFAEVDIVSGDGALAATATGVFRVLRPKPPPASG